MRGEKDQSLWNKVVELARKQHWAIGRRQLRALGMSDKAIEYSLAAGRLHRTQWRGVFAVGRPELTKYGTWRAAQLSRGPYAVLTHDSAGALWEFWKPRTRLIHLSLPAVGRPRSGRGVVVHRRRLRPRDLTRQRGIPVTTPLRTVIDLAATCDRSRAERLINDADATGLLTADTLHAALDSVEGQPGVPLLREILDPATFVLTESHLEQLFLPLVRKAGLPKPESQRRFGKTRVDFYWPELGLVVECDSLRFHRTPVQQAEDRERDHAHLRAGRTPVRFTHDQVAHGGDRVAATLAETAACLRP